MSENELCWECREWLAIKPFDRNNPTLHCHHKPKEKKKCICRGYTLSESMEKFEVTCKICGRKL